MTPLARPADRFHRAVWRWHFYAGLLVLPLLIWLALTGQFDHEVNRVARWLHAQYNALTR